MIEQFTPICRGVVYIKRSGGRQEWGAVLATVPVATILASIGYPTVVKVHIGPLAISPHGVGIAVGFLAGARLMLPEANRKGIFENDVYPLLTRAAIGAIVGARLAYVINHIGDYSSPLDALKVWQGGISLLGGFIGAILLALPEMKKRRLSFWKVMDAAAPGMALGVIIGRIGDLIVGDHLGKQTSFFLGFKCPTNHDTASPCIPGPGSVVHQTALYDFVLTILLIGVLLWLRRRRDDWYPGFLIMVFGAWYGCQRILEDFLREDKHILGTGLTGSQITAIITVLLCLWHLAFVRRTPRWGRWDERPDEQQDGRSDEQSDEQSDERTDTEPLTTSLGSEPQENEE